MPTHILFDFFGTLVDYPGGGRPDAYPKTVAALGGMGIALTDREFQEQWTAAWMALEHACQADHREFTVDAVTREFCRGALDAEQMATVTRLYLEEWNAGVYYLDGLAEWIRALSKDYRLAVVSNTNEPYLVPGHLEKMQIRDCFDLVVLSVEIGWRKPHKRIYAAALDGLGIDPGQAVFVGDSHVPDYVGPRQAGIASYLIDPHRRWGVPEESRLHTVFELSTRL